MVRIPRRKSKKKKKKEAEALPPIDVDQALNLAADIRKLMYDWRKKTPPPPRPGATTLDDLPFVAGGSGDEAMRLFDYETVAQAFESLVDEINTELEAANKELTETALRVYWAALKLSKDPEHADLIEHVEKMRKAYFKDFGKEIPPPPPEYE